MAWNSSRRQNRKLQDLTPIGARVLFTKKTGLIFRLSKMRICAHKHFACLPRWYSTCLSLLSMDQRFNVLAFFVNRTRSYINFDYEEHQGKNQKCNAQHKQEGYRLRYFKPIQSLNKHTEDDDANKPLETAKLIEK